MGSNINFNSFVNEPPGDGSGRPPGWGNFPLTRQSSIYSLTFDEFQNTLGTVGKDFGSMNMDELLKNIWSAEETQSMATAATTIAAVGAGSGVQEGGGHLQRQGSLTLPRTLSTMTVDQVWKDLAKEFTGGKDSGAGGGSNVPQRQPTLGEMTLEEFLVRAGVVREDTQPFGKPDLGSNGIFGDLTRPSNNGDSGFGITFQQPSQGVDLLGNHISEINNNNNQLNIQSTTNLPLNVNGVRTTQQQTPQLQQQQQQQQQQPQQRQQPIFPKQPGVTYGNGQLGSPRIGGGIVGLGDTGMNNNLMPNSILQGGGGMGMIGIPAGSPANLTSNGLAKSNDDTSSVSPVPYMFNGGFRGRKSGNSVDKVVERRQRRMIKNRESAARSRARKQAYTMELEQEIAKLKEENEELRKKQEEILEQQKNQALEMLNAQSGPRKKLRRTQTGIW